jgi:hypothetical protein
MSKRRKIGDKVIKKENAGFIGAKLVCMIPDYPENQNCDERCFHINGCTDENCIEWPTLVVLNKDGNEDGIACHVSECEMEDL